MNLSERLKHLFQIVSIRPKKNTDYGKDMGWFDRIKEIGDIRAGNLSEAICTK